MYVLLSNWAHLRVLKDDLRWGVFTDGNACRYVEESRQASRPCKPLLPATVLAILL